MRKDASRSGCDLGLITPLFGNHSDAPATKRARLFLRNPILLPSVSHLKRTIKWGFFFIIYLFLFFYLHESCIPWPTEYESVRVCELRWSVRLSLSPACTAVSVRHKTFPRQDAAAQSCVGTDRSGDLLLSHSPYPLPPAQRR